METLANFKMRNTQVWMDALCDVKDTQRMTRGSPLQMSSGGRKRSMLYCKKNRKEISKTSKNYKMKKIEGMRPNIYAVLISVKD